MHPRTVSEIFNFFGVLSLSIKDDVTKLTNLRVLLNTIKVTFFGLCNFYVGLGFLDDDDSLENDDFSEVSEFWLINIVGNIMLVLPFVINLLQLLNAKKYSILINQALRLRFEMIQHCNSAGKIFDEFASTTQNLIICYFICGSISTTAEFFFAKKLNFNTVSVVVLYGYFYFATCFSVFLAFVLLQFIQCVQKVLISEVQTTSNESQPNQVLRLEHILIMRSELYVITQKLVEIMSFSIFWCLIYLNIQTICEVSFTLILF